MKLLVPIFFLVASTFAIITMHIGIGVMMGLYLFSLVMIVLDLAALGPGLLRRYPTTEMTPKVAKRDS